MEGPAREGLRGRTAEGGRGRRRDVVLDDGLHGFLCRGGSFRWTDRWSEVRGRDVRGWRKSGHATGDECEAERDPGRENKPRARSVEAGSRHGSRVSDDGNALLTRDIEETMLRRRHLAVLGATFFEGEYQWIAED
ncbi:MAG: hypothetical protein AUH85_14575 [Chloroflexi bacterium 13_1_40CM_4_68_4]|nr:MAG: hypothetical protein AUH85_14575 [Chloroflexi bacterium 13_1_40CM_4_68_4]